MQVALVVLEMEPERENNRSSIARWVERAARSGAELVVFPEGAVTGLVNNDDAAHDLPLGEPVPGPTTDLVSAAAREHGVLVALGLLEREGDALYDTAVLVDRRGRVIHRHRRTHPGWHSSRADPAVYRQGTEIEVAETDLGSIVFLLCGELFDDEALARARDLEPDIVLVLLWRCFDDGSADQARWEAEELADYTARAAALGATVLAVNGLAPSTMEGGSFGGAWAWDAGGRLCTALPLGRSDLLVLRVGSCPGPHSPVPSID